MTHLPYVDYFVMSFGGDGVISTLIFVSKSQGLTKRKFKILSLCQQSYRRISVPWIDSKITFNKMCSRFSKYYEKITT